jgi:signal transduction histidine kinase
VAHDFRNLLTTIMLYADKARNDPRLPPGLASHLETIKSESRKAANLVQQILDFSSSSPIEPRPTDVQQLVRNVISVLRHSIPPDIRVEHTFAPGDFVVEADPGRLEQVLMNLSLNARDAMPNGGELRFELSRTDFEPGDEPPVAKMSPGGWVCLVVSDTGTGMTPDVVSHVFEPFFTTKEVGKGTGMGLAQVYGIVRQHGGHVALESEVGEGSTFRVYLPAEGPRTD